MVYSVTTKAEFDEIIQSHKRVAVDFTATWCGPCQFIGPKFEALAANYTSIKFIKVDVDQNSETAEDQRISAMPTFKFFKDGQKFDEDLVGADESKLTGIIERLSND